MRQNSREALIFYARILAEKGLVVGSEGNFSVKAKYGFWITPSGRIKQNLTPKDLVFVGWDQSFINGCPSSEWGMHYLIYQKNFKANAVIHTHSLYTLIMSAKGFDFYGFSLKEAELLLKKMAKVPFLSPGSKELWERVGEASLTSKVLLLEGHGVVAWGETIEEAVSLCEVLEKLSKFEFFKNLG
ncbi:class II aldolase/adducin family protein [Thermodesulfobacterium sp. TA1]|uniref:class II aldolase/adducin family protein n=1 Tax=Thermodesulfobacterium sp. TA1 TaxID=2234087 RepID=UPI0012321084|nr:class II aldolase/adducin family protein [Thermodesulfobacterium sp. TA1]QER42391.1 class II aldolase/adducin family protein [Thermodesulfobacterium sp. TA1]